MTKMSEYKVVFAVYATIQDMYDDTGCVVYSGTTHTYGGYSLSNARVSLAICARSPRDAYNNCLQMMEEGNVNFGKANVETWGLEYVTDGYNSWSSSDLR